MCAVVRVRCLCVGMYSASVCVGECKCSMVLVFGPSLSGLCHLPVPRPAVPVPHYPLSIIHYLPLLAWPLADDGIVGSSISATKYYKFRASSPFPALSSFLTHNKYKKCGRSYFDLHARISKVLTADFRFSP
ncbi:hypothetical protein F4813DRAFT_17010 [Daldinia decipiens]|uniref:uncharacterized protein n=1 Tax=Daldinia decipiens TaxID=326647 RepID=UPI0020C36E61|nr:uncharacterized protein F4813DRAFT_17010 [Daldinia decipiens]KAI1663013.1 hypothetical protein F4813DRAFT_17010 [Daldinia decipiens]